MSATGSPRHEGSKPSAYGSIVTIRLYRNFWIYPSPLLSCFVLPIELTQVDAAGNCDGIYGATGGLTDQRSPEYHENGVQTTEDTTDRILAVRRA